MKNISRFIKKLILGGILGLIITSIVAPKLIIWYYTPPSQIPFNCKPSMEWAFDILNKAQVIGVLVGVFLMSFFIALSRIGHESKNKEHNKNSSQQTPS